MDGESKWVTCSASTYIDKQIHFKLGTSSNLNLKNYHDKLISFSDNINKVHKHVTTSGFFSQGAKSVWEIAKEAGGYTLLSVGSTVGWTGAATLAYAANKIGETIAFTAKLCMCAVSGDPSDTYSMSSLENNKLEIVATGITYGLLLGNYLSGDALIQRESIIMYAAVSMLFRALLDYFTKNFTTKRTNTEDTSFLYDDDTGFLLSEQTRKTLQKTGCLITAIAICAYILILSTNFDKTVVDLLVDYFLYPQNFKIPDKSLNSSEFLAGDGVKTNFMALNDARINQYFGTGSEGNDSLGNLIIQSFRQKHKQDAYGKTGYERIAMYSTLYDYLKDHTTTDALVELTSMLLNSKEFTESMFYKSMSNIPAVFALVLTVKQVYDWLGNSPLRPVEKKPPTYLDTARNIINAFFKLISSQSLITTGLVAVSAASVVKYVTFADIKMIIGSLLDMTNDNSENEWFKFTKAYPKFENLQYDLHYWADAANTTNLHEMYDILKKQNYPTDMTPYDKFISGRINLVLFCTFALCVYSSFELAKVIAHTKKGKQQTDDGNSSVGVPVTFEPETSGSPKVGAMDMFDDLYNNDGFNEPTEPPASSTRRRNGARSEVVRLQAPSTTRSGRKYY